MKKEAERVKKDEALKDRILVMLDDHLVCESHTGKIVRLTGEYEFEPRQASGTLLHYRNGAPAIDELPKLSCKFRGQKYRIKDLISTHLSALVDQVNAGQITLTVVALASKLLTEKVEFHCPVCQQSDCPDHWRNRLSCGAATLKIRPK